MKLIILLLTFISMQLYPSMNIISEREDNNIIYENPNDYSNITKITIDKLENKIEHEKDFILVITQTGCSHCENYLPVLNEVLKSNHMYAYELNIAELSLDEYNSFKEIVNFSGTPTTVFFKDGEEKSIKDRLVGNVGKDKITEKLKELDYIN